MICPTRNTAFVSPLMMGTDILGQRLRARSGAERRLLEGRAIHKYQLR
jgi:hypothetical protein